MTRVIESVVCALAVCASSAAQPIGQAVYVGDDMIKAYDPTPALVTDATEVTRSRFPSIDIHCHWSLREDPAALLRVMDERNVQRAINLSGGWGSHLDQMLEQCTESSDGRLLVFCNVDFSRIDEPGFGEQAAAEIRRGRARGVAGLKIFKNLGLTVRDASGEIVAIDDPRLDPIWAVCGELGMPVLIHSADPVAFFQPIDEDNERWMQLQRHPDWSFYGDEFPDREEVLAQRNRMMTKHRQTTFIGAHMGGNAEDLAALAEVLDAHPNFVVDMSARVAELGRQPYTARKFFIEYQDRILYGTDRYPGRANQPRHPIYCRFLETDDEYFKYYDHPFPPTGEWRIYGIYLPHEVLEKVYTLNAERVLGVEGE